MIEEFANDLRSCYQQFTPCCRTNTRDGSHDGLTGLKGRLLMEGKRTYTKVARKMLDPVADGQNLQHVMSDSPWESRPIFDEMQGQIRERFPVKGSRLKIDESGDEGSSPGKAGSQKPYLGRLGKTEVDQVGGAHVGIMMGCGR